MFDDLPALVGEEPGLRDRGRHLTTDFLVESGDSQYLFTVTEGELAVRTGPFVSPRWRFALRAAPETWERFWQPVPVPGWHDLMAMIKFKTLVAEGDLHPFMSNLLWFKDVLSAPRRVHEGAAR